MTSEQTAFLASLETELTALVACLQKEIGDDYRASEDDETPSMQITIATNDAIDAWTYQTGDNSYTGGCYHFPHWGVGAIYRDSNPADVAKGLIADMLEAMPN